MKLKCSQLCQNKYSYDNIRSTRSELYVMNSEVSPYTKKRQSACLDRFVLFSVCTCTTDEPVCSNTSIYFIHETFYKVTNNDSTNFSSTFLALTDIKYFDFKN